MARVKTFIRIKPSVDSGYIKYDKCQITIEDKKMRYEFDEIFGPETSQSSFYDAAVAPFVKDALEGFNCTFITYGQSKSGKAYTLDGTSPINLFSITNECKSGIIPRTCNDVLKTLYCSGNIDFMVKISYFAICKEKIVDLLADSFTEKKLKICEGSKGEMYVQNLKEVVVKNIPEFNRVLKEGNKKMYTSLNKQSSFFHSVFTLKVIVNNNMSNTCKIGKITFVKLAGSNPTSFSGVTSGTESQNENLEKSLSTLSRVITHLANGTAYIPFRNSNLTHYLKSSIQGNTKTVLIATLSAAHKDVDETLKTLNFATLAKSLINFVFANILRSDELKAQRIYYEREVRKEYVELKSTNPTLFNEKLKRELAQKHQDEKEVQDYLNKLKEKNYFRIQAQQKLRNEKQIKLKMDYANMKVEIDKLRKEITEYEHSFRSFENNLTIMKEGIMDTLWKTYVHNSLEIISNTNNLKTNVQEKQGLEKRQLQKNSCSSKFNTQVKKFVHIETEIEGLIKEIHDKSKQLTELHNCAAEKIKKINLSAYDCIPVHEYKNDIQGVMKSFERDFNLLQTNFMTKKNTNINFRDHVSLLISILKENVKQTKISSC
ncbi:kinesin-like protein KLP2 isoform X2 [Cimex lectularius]|uniref:Kinesin motor domain-containing protein n=1 Tax=Cimex lectularius TaxID=79782 RepID=A0A8I6SH75_CIMLE|nr:kinesin-like protein KLP2 isoform X2 [Cimex lectularius]